MNRATRLGLLVKTFYLARAGYEGAEEKKSGRAKVKRERFRAAQAEILYSRLPLNIRLTLR